ncbi:hypothetical protein ACXZ65_33890 [Streptomyces aculeolatus]
MNTSDQPTGPEAKLAANVVAAVEQYERDRRGAGSTSDDHAHRLDHVYHLADSYTRNRDDAAKLGEFLDGLANELDLADFRALRLASDAVVAATPRAILAAANHGMKPRRIAEQIGLTPARVYGILREEQKKQLATMAESAVRQQVATGGDPGETIAFYEAVRERQPEGLRGGTEELLEVLREAAAKQQAAHDDPAAE